MKKVLALLPKPWYHDDTFLFSLRLVARYFFASQLLRMVFAITPPEILAAQATVTVLRAFVRAVFIPPVQAEERRATDCALPHAAFTAFAFSRLILSIDMPKRHFRWNSASASSSLRLRASSQRICNAVGVIFLRNSSNS